LDAKVRFEWNDFSVCENAFAITRREAGARTPVKSFVADYPHEQVRTCGSRIEPEALFDDLTMAEDIQSDGPRVPGAGYVYCVRAVAPVGLGASSGAYESNEACEAFVVQFEAIVTGTVLTNDARAPVPDVEISYHLRGENPTDAIRGGAGAASDIALTGADGKFQLRILFQESDSAFSSDIAIRNANIMEQDIVVYAEKKGPGEFTHEFLCSGGQKCCGRSGEPCADTGQLAHFPLTVRHTNLAVPLNILEMSSIPFSGKVFFRPMQPELIARGATHPTTWPSAWKTSGDVGECKLRGAKVCMLRADDSREEIMCTKTDINGEYLLNAPPDMEVLVKISVLDRDADKQERFVRTRDSIAEDATRIVHAAAGKFAHAMAEAAADQNDDGVPAEEVFFIDSTESARNAWSDMNYEDQTVRVARFGAHGTKCELPLGGYKSGSGARFDLRFTDDPDCTEGYSYELNTEVFTDAEVVLPAHEFDITFVEVLPQSYPDATDAGSAGYFGRLGQRTQRVNFSKQPADPNTAIDVIFEYRPKPELSFSIADVDRNTDQSLTSTCPAGFTITEDEGTEAPLQNDIPSPKWELVGGAVQKVTVFAVEKLHDALNLPSCSNVEGDIKIKSELGFSPYEVSLLGMDETDALRMELVKVISMSLSIDSESKFEEMMTCSASVKQPDPLGGPSRKSRHCVGSLASTTVAEFKSFKDQYTCQPESSTDSTDLMGFVPFGQTKSDGASTSAAAAGNPAVDLRNVGCEQAWEGTLAAVSDLHDWVRLTWDRPDATPATSATPDERLQWEQSFVEFPSITDEERTAWESVGVQQSDWVGGWDDWKGFSGSVMAVVPTWPDLNPTQAATVRNTLHFSEETWGRMWLLRHRMVSGEASLLPWWDENGVDPSLTQKETEHLVTLGWTKIMWEGDTEPATVSTKWAELSCNQQKAARALGFWSHTWRVDEQAAVDVPVDVPVGVPTCDVPVYGPPAPDLDTLSPSPTPTANVDGCFWDAAQMRAVTTRPVPSPSFGSQDTPRYSTLCERASVHDVSYSPSHLRVGLPGQTARSSIRSITATMQVAGHPLVVHREHAVITGDRWISDLNAVPFPRGKPLLVLHDPPGGASSSTFENVRIRTEFAHKGKKVKVGTTRAETGDTGILEHEITQDICMSTGMAPGPQPCLGLTKGGKIEAYVHVLDNSHADLKESGGETTRLLPDNAVEISVSYSTSAEPDAAGPMADMFLMPSGTIEISTTHFVGVDKGQGLGVNKGEGQCKIIGKSSTSMRVLLQLNGFYFISAADVESRVIPQLKEVLLRPECDAEAQREGASTREKAEKCCVAFDKDMIEKCQASYFSLTDEEREQLDDTNPWDRWCTGLNDGDEDGIIDACEHKDETVDNPIDTLLEYCQSTCPDPKNCDEWMTKCTDLDAWDKLSEDDRTRVGDAKDNWIEALERNYDLLRKIKEANDGDPVSAFKELCETGYQPKAAEADKAAIKVCGLTELAPQVMLEESTDFQDYNVLSFGGGGAAMEYNYMINAAAPGRFGTDFQPREIEVEVLVDSVSDTPSPFQELDDRGEMDIDLRVARGDASVTRLDAIKSTAIKSFALKSTGAKELKKQLFGSKDRRINQDEIKSLSTLDQWMTGENGNGEKTVEIQTGVHGSYAGPVGVGAAIDLQSGLSEETLSMSTRVTTIDDKSHASFSLEDPDGGDYFVVQVTFPTEDFHPICTHSCGLVSHPGRSQVFKDPYYGTPLFYTAKGASSCPREANTAARSAPAITAKYIGGSGELDPTKPALFAVTLYNNDAYYESRQRQSIDRPLWMPRDMGYEPPTMALSLNAPLLNGLQLAIDGKRLVPGEDIQYSWFARGTQQVIVEVLRGPLENEFEFEAPVLKFDEKCTDNTGDTHPTTELRMDGDGEAIRFARSCANVAWSGSILEQQTFKSNSDGGICSSHAVDFVVRNRGPTPWHSSISSWSEGMKMFFEYRRSGQVSWIKGEVIVTGPEAAVPTKPPDSDLKAGEINYDQSDKAEDFVQATWCPPIGDGAYDIRIVATCFGGGSQKVVSSTTEVTGRVGAEPLTSHQEFDLLRDEILSLKNMIVKDDPAAPAVGGR
jgi:hypothetical protein